MSDTPKTPLFATHDLSDELDRRLRAVGRKVDEMPQDQFMTTNPGTLIVQMVADLSVAPLVLHHEQMRKESSPIDISMAGRRDYGRITKPGESRPGRRLRYVIPFTGDEGLWHARPGFKRTPNEFGEVDAVQRTLTLTFECTLYEKPEWDDRKYQTKLQTIGLHIQSQGHILDEYHRKLQIAVHEAVMQRSLQIQQSQDLAAALSAPPDKKPG